MNKKQKISATEMNVFAEELYERLQQEEKIKDEEGLTDEGIALWYASKLSNNLNWDGNYCIPTKGNLEKKAAILRKAINVITFDTRELYETNDFLVIIERLTLSLNRLNADLGVSPYYPPAIEKSNKKSRGTSRILWTGDDEKMKKLASLLEENKFIENANKWLEHFSTSTQEKVESGPIQWLQKKYQLQFLLRKLNAIGHIQYPKAFQPHFLVNGKPLDGLGGGNQDYNHLVTIEDIIKLIN